MSFGRAFTQQCNFGGLKIQTFKNWFPSASVWKQHSYNLRVNYKHEFVKMVKSYTAVWQWKHIPLAPAAQFCAEINARGSLELFRYGLWDSDFVVFLFVADWNAWI